MATLIANAATTQNLTGAATFAAAEAGALAAVLNRNTTTSIATATTVTSATFTVTNTKVIDAVLLWVKTSGTTGTGTFKVDLQKGGVSQASVTVNKSDLPDSTNSIACPVLFKLTSTATGDGGANWTIVLTTTSGTGSATVTINIASATTTNYTRALRTTTAATAAAADDLYIVGELTGAGTHTSRTVTMDSTAATAYGNGAVNSTTVSGGCIQVSCYGTLSYGTSTSTAYILRVAGDVMVYQNGTLNIGSSGSEIPRNSTAVLEFQPVSADGDFGLRCLENSTVNGYGLSRTSGKNVVKCKLTADVTSAAVSNSVTNAAITISANGLEASGNSLLATGVNDTVTNTSHYIVTASPVSVTNTTQVGVVWLARGSGTNNRFVRVQMGNVATFGSITDGFYSDIDLQAGTAGTITAVGTGTATSVSIVAVGAGYLVKITGKVKTTATITYLHCVASQGTVAAGTVSFAGAANQCFLIDHANIITASSVSDTTFNVDTDTGWLSGDAVVVPSTTRTVAECEIFPLNANAGASSFTSALYPFGTNLTGSGGTFASTHSGTAAAQGEVGLLTRNVKIRSTSTLLMTYVYCTALSAVNFSWVEFYYIGTTTTNKRGIEVDTGTTATAKSITFCSLHDMDNFGLFLVGGSASANLTFSNNVMWFNSSSSLVTVSTTVSSGNYTFDSNLLVKTASNGFNLLEMTGSLTNNTVASASSSGWSIAAGTLTTIGSFDNNTAHSCAANGFVFGATGLTGTIAGLSSWRNGSAGVVFSSYAPDLLFTTLTAFGNSSGNISLSTCDSLNIVSGTIAGDTSFSVASGILVGSANCININLGSVDMSGVGGVYAPHTTQDLSTNTATMTEVAGVLLNCKFGAPIPITLSKSTWAKGSYLSFEKYNQVAGDHRDELTYGQLRSDPTLYNTAAPSMRMTPISATFKLESATKNRGIVKTVASGATVSISVYVRKSASGDGATYNGNQPRLIQRANPALGQNSDVVLATYSAGTGAWTQLTATSSTATDAGAWEFIIDCDGTVGWVNVDDWA